MIIKYDSSTKSLSIERDALQDRFSGHSQELVHNLIRVLLRPNCESTAHWLDECYLFLYDTLAEATSVKRKPIEYLFDDVAHYCNNPKYFYLVKESIQNEVETVIDEKVYGNCRNISNTHVAFGLWIFYQMIDPKIIYSKNDLMNLINGWYEVISANPIDWIYLTDIEIRSMRYYPNNKTFSLTLNY